MNLSNQDVQLGQAMFESSATQKHPLGTRGSDTFGRVWRYVKAGAVDLAMAWHGSAAARIVAANPDRVPATLTDLATPVIGQLSLEIAELHEATVTRSDSLLTPSGKGLGSPSSRYERTSSRSASSTFSRASSRVRP